MFSLAATPRGRPLGRCRALWFHSDQIPDLRQDNRSNGPYRLQIRREIGDGGIDERQKSATGQKETSPAGTTAVEQLERHDERFKKSQSFWRCAIAFPPARCKCARAPRRRRKRGALT